jgi:hypothetical protein
MAKQGCPLEETEIRTIVRLLDSTEMTIGDIAQRIGRSRAAVVSINRRFQLRDYRGQRSSWKIKSELKQA